MTNPAKKSSIGVVAALSIGVGDENHGNSPESIIEIPHPVRAVVGH
jgi:hypothetical protein